MADANRGLAGGAFRGRRINSKEIVLSGSLSVPVVVLG